MFLIVNRGKSFFKLVLLLLKLPTKLLYIRKSSMRPDKLLYRTCPAFTSRKLPEELKFDPCVSRRFSLAVETKSLCRTCRARLPWVNRSERITWPLTHTKLRTDDDKKTSTYQLPPVQNIWVKSNHTFLLQSWAQNGVFTDVYAITARFTFLSCAFYALSLHIGLFAAGEAGVSEACDLL